MRRCGEWRGREGGSRNDPPRNRCGCFLPDLTGLAKTTSARLPMRIWQCWGEFATRVCQVGFQVEFLVLWQYPSYRFESWHLLDCPPEIIELSQLNYHGNLRRTSDILFQALYFLRNEPIKFHFNIFEIPSHDLFRRKIG